MRTAGRIGSAPFPRINYAGICSAAPLVAQSSKTNFSSLLTSNASALISQARRLRTPFLLPLSAPGTLALSASPALTLLESAVGRVSYIIRAHRLPLRALLLPPLRPPAVHSRSIRFPL